MLAIFGKSRARFYALGATFFAIVAMVLTASGAFASTQLTSTLSTTSTTAGSKVDLTTQIPAVSAVDNSTQEIIQSIDPTKVRLTAVSDVIAPQGWTVTYSQDGGTTWLATPTAWGSVNKVKATGSVNSGGATIDGKQIASVSATALGTVATQNGTVRSGGDGLETAFDSRGYIYTIYHHNALSGSLDCRVKATGAFCPGSSWPFALSTFGFNSSFTPSEFYDEVNSHVWIPATETSVGTGFLCVDVSNISAPVFCGGSKATAWHLLQARSGANERGLNNIIASNGQIYSWDILAPKMLCFDYLANNGLGAACSRAVPTFSKLAAGSPPSMSTMRPTMTFYTSFQEVFGNIYGELNGVATCFKAATMAKCAGWTDFDYSVGLRYVTGTTRTAMAMYIQPSAQGIPAGVCFTSDAMCFDSSGSRFNADATVQAALINDGVLRFHGTITTTGSKILFSNLWDAPSYVFCYDYATSAACANWAASSMHGVTGVGQMLMTPSGQASWRVYTMKADPDSANCIWINGDGGGPGIGQFTVSTATFGCQVPSSTAVFTQAALQPRLACSIGSDYHYRNFKISGVTQGADYTTAALTITKADGTTLVSGGRTWANVALNSSGLLDISAISPTDIGTGATFSIKYTGKTGSANTVGSIEAESLSAQLCLSVTAQTVCPATTQITNLTTQLASFSAIAATISSGGSRTDYNANASDLSIAPPATPSACGFQLVGQVAQGTNAVNYPTAPIKPVVGAIATLRDSTGTVINDPVSGLPITATTDASGNYTFGYLKAGTYKVSFADFPLVNGYGTGDVAMTYVGASRYMGGEYTMTPQNPAGNFTTIQTPLVSLAVTGTTGGADVSVKASYVMRAVAVNDTVSVKAGATANTIDVIANDTPTTTATFTSSSLKICAAGTTTACALTTLTVANQGTYTVTSGKIAFTPVAGFTGVATAINYGVADGYSNTPQTVNASLTVTVVPAPTTAADTESGNLLAPITVNVVTNDTAATGTTLVASSVKLCASGTTTGCALTSVAIAGKGTYSVDALGVVTFTPETAYIGTAPAITYSVTDGVGNVSTNTVTATVTATPPTITTPALPNAALGVVMPTDAQTLTTGNVGLPATGAWVITTGSLPPGLNLNANTGAITGTPTATGTFPFTVQVTDLAGLTATKAESISVFDGPTITTTPLSHAVYAGSPLTITDTVNIGSGAILTTGGWSATGLPAGMTINTTTGVISGTPTTDGVYPVVVKVTDVNSLSDTETITITVTTKPVITTATPLTRAVQGVAITAIPQTKTQGTAAIPATGAWAITTGALPAGLSFNPDTGEITGTATATGTFTFTVQLTDAAGEVATKVETITVLAPPTITTTPLNYKFYASSTGNTVTNTVTIGSGAIATSGWSASGLPAGMTINSGTGLISGTPTTNGTYTVTVRATDINSLFDEETLTIVVVTKPVITTVMPTTKFPQDVALTAIPQTKTVGSGVIPATGAWSVVAGPGVGALGNLPPGLTLNPDTGEITGTPTAPGVYDFTVKLVASDGEIATKAEKITVIAPPTITTTPLTYKYYNGSTVTLLNTATKGTGNLLTVGAWAASALPTGLSLNANTGAITGTPTADGSYTLSLTVTDENGLTDTESLVIDVVTKPVITTVTPLLQNVMGIAIEPEAQTVDEGTGAIPATGAWSLVPGVGVLNNLPAGLVLDPDTGEITGTPTASGLFAFTVKVTDDLGEVATKVLTMNVVAPPEITTLVKVYTKQIDTFVSMPNMGLKGTAIIEPTGAWTAVGLPNGFVINPDTGEITGIGAVEGNFDIDVTVTDEAGLTDTITMTLHVVKPPVITTDPASYKFDLGTVLAPKDITPIINTANKGTANIGAAGAWTSTALPEGLALNADTGEITGNPTKAGSYLVMVTVTDEAGLTDTKALTIAVVDPAKNLTILTLPSALVDGAVPTDAGFPLAPAGSPQLGISTKKLPVSYTAGPPAVCYVDSSKVLRLMGVGDCSVTATSGTGSLLSTDKKTFKVLKSPQTVTITLPGATGPDGKVAPAATDSPNGFKLVAKLSSGLPPVFTSLDPAICLVEDDGTVTWMSDLVATPLKDTCPVRVTQPGNANFYPLVDTDDNIIQVKATHTTTVTPAPTNPPGALGTPHAPGTYNIGGQWIITVTKTQVTIKPWSSGKFIGPVTADISVPYTVKIKNKVVKKIQTCKVVFGITKAFAMNDPKAWKSKAYDNAKPCALNKDAFAYYMTGKTVNATAKVVRDRRWPTTMEPFKGDYLPGTKKLPPGAKPIPKDYKNWKLNIG